MKELKKLVDDLFEAMIDLDVLIKNQSNTLAVWDENNPVALCKRKYREDMKRDIDRRDGIKSALKAVLKELDREL
jgi:hypothetical protein